MKFYCIFLTLILATLTSPALSDMAGQVEILDIRKSPNTTEWQTLNRLSASKLGRLWRYHSSRGKSLKDWSWEWRIGWVRLCLKPSNKPIKHCGKIIESGLTDPALVVRSETAKHLGYSYRGTENLRVVQLLASAYKDQRNYRNNKPLFIQKYILFALTQIKGKEAQVTGGRLASQNLDTKKYWKKINRF